MGYQPRPAGLSGLGSTDNAIVRTNGTGGNSAQGSIPTIDDAGNITAVGGTFTTLTAASGAVTCDASGNLGCPTLTTTVYAVIRDQIYLRGSSILSFGNGDDVTLQRRGADNPAFFRGTNDTTLSIGAASGTGGGVIDLNKSDSDATSDAGHGGFYTKDIGAGTMRMYCTVDCGGFGGVPGTLTIDTGWTPPESVGDKTDAVENYSGSGINGTMAAALELVSAGLGTALQQDEARIKELIHQAQAIHTALVSLLAPNA